MKKCPPGIICVENVTLLLLFIILLVVCIFIYSSMKQNITINEKDYIRIDGINGNGINGNDNGIFSGLLPSWPYNNLQNDVLLNPYSAPFKDERYMVPINVSTNIGAVPTDTAYRQMGIMTPLNGSSKDNILPLMGRPLFTNRDKWQYYTISNQHNNVKLPVSFKGRSGLNDNGVDQIYNGDTIYVEGYNEAFKVTIYDNNTIRYLPFV